MTDQEIIKALRECAEGDCNKCLYSDPNRCQENLLKDAADRLEELTASRNVMKMREDA